MRHNYGINLQKATKRVKVTMKVMTVDEAGWVELQEEHIQVDANAILTVYSSTPFKRERVICNGKLLTDEVSAMSYISHTCTHVHTHVHTQQEWEELEWIHRLKFVADGREIVVTPLILYSDDTKGNQSKKWNKFDLWAMMFAGLSNEENHHLENIHFLTTSNQISPLEMVEPLVKEYVNLEKNGLVTYDAHRGKTVLVIAPLICDNPRASELLNHLGATARHYCRICMVSIQN